jgi:hypothetical protein
MDKSSRKHGAARAWLSIDGRSDPQARFGFPPIRRGREAANSKTRDVSIPQHSLPAFAASQLWLDQAKSTAKRLRSASEQ